MKILKIYPNIDKPTRYNYHVNYGVWDAIEGDRDSLENFSSDLSNYDVVFVPMYKRWIGRLGLLNRIKDHKIKTVLFDNDSCYRSFNDPFYNGFDYIFYRDLDRDQKKHATILSSRLMWSIDTDLYSPKFGGTGISFNCSLHIYPVRLNIARVIVNTSHRGKAYIKHLQNSAGAIHTNNFIVPGVRAKILEFASCGTQIISNPSKYMGDYFPKELIIEFGTVSQLQDIIKNFTPDIQAQKQLREITVEKHDNKIRSRQILKIVEAL